MIEERVKEYWAELERRSIDVIGLRDHEYGYVGNRESIDKRIEKWQKMIEKLHAKQAEGQ